MTPNVDERRRVVQVDQRRPPSQSRCGISNRSMLGGRAMLVMPPAVTEPLGVVGDQPDDLAEAERDDRQVVAAHPQRRRAEDDPGDHRGHDRDREHQQERQCACCDGEHADRVRADGVEADVAEVEQAGVADHDVEAERDQHVGRHGEQHAPKSEPWRWR